MDSWQQLSQFNTAEISDALDSLGVEGALLHIGTFTPGCKLIGPAYTVKYLPYKEKPATFQNAGNYIDAVPAQSVIVIDNEGREDCTVWGDILTRFALTKEIAGTVIHGAARDIAFIREVNYPLFCRNAYMRSGKNRIYKADEQCSLTINDVTIKPGDIMFGDDNGVLVIPANLVDAVITHAKNIQNTEEKIIAAIKAGMSLAEARKTHHYDRPWLEEEK